MDSSSSSRNNNDVPYATLLEWYKIRDTFFGVNHVSQSIPLALMMSACCDHPDARWLSEACAGKDVKTVEDSKRVFSSFGRNDARALCFLWCCGGMDLTSLRRSAELGFAFAQAFLAEKEGSKDEMFKFAQLSAAQGERDGFYVLGLCFKNGDACTWKRQEKTFCMRANSAMFGQCIFSANCFASRFQSAGDGGARRQPSVKQGGFCPSLQHKSSCSILALETVLSCLQSDEHCEDM
jgi:hypothetical protein